MNFLTTFADQLLTAAEHLEREGGPSQKMIYQLWAEHLRSDRRSIVLLAETYREPVEAE